MPARRQGLTRGYLARTRFRYLRNYGTEGCRPRQAEWNTQAVPCIRRWIELGSLTRGRSVPLGEGIVARLRRLPVIGNPAFRIADYRRLWFGAACNHLGMSGEQVVLGLLVFQITDSTAWVGILMAIY